MIRIIPSGGITLRPFKINDAATILSWCRYKRAFRLWSADRYKDFPARPEEMMEQYRGENMYPLTAVVGEAIVGHILLRRPSKDKSVIRLGFVIVDDSKRGKGYGKQMLRHAIDYARRRALVPYTGTARFPESVGRKILTQGGYNTGKKQQPVS